MGACETTPTSHAHRGSQPTDPRPQQPAGSSSLPIIGRRSPASSSFVLAPRPPRAPTAPGAPTGPRTTRRHEPGTCKESQQNRPPSPTTRSHRVRSARPLDKQDPHGCCNTVSIQQSRGTTTRSTTAFRRGGSLHTSHSTLTTHARRARTVTAAPARNDTGDKVHDFLSTAPGPPSCAALTHRNVRPGPRRTKGP